MSEFKWEYLWVKDKWFVRNHLSNPEAEARWDLTKDLTSITSMISENKKVLTWRLTSITTLINKKIETGKLDTPQAERLIREYDNRLKAAVLEARKKWDGDVTALMGMLDGIIASANNPKANPEHVTVNKNSNPDTNSLLSFVKGNTGIGRTVGNRTPGDIK